MLHVRYDWRRPFFWATLCLSLFLSSQTRVAKDEKIPVSEMMKVIVKEKPLAEQERGESKSYDNFSMYLFVAK